MSGTIIKSRKNNMLQHPNLDTSNIPSTLTFNDDIAKITPFGQDVKPVVSIICVNYYSDTQVVALMKSMAKNSIPCEFIVIDNSTQNRGYGGAINLAAMISRAPFLFVINPDCQGSQHILAELLEASRRLSHKACIVPQLTNSEGTPYLSCTKTLGWLQMVVCHSIINRVWRSNPVSRNFWYDAFSLEYSRFVDSASGAAMFFPRYLLEQIGRFDENYFLYFEDTDLCRRLGQEKIPIWFEAQCKIVHQKAGATPDSGQAAKFFRQSRWQYSKQYFGLLPALLSEGWLRFQELF